MNSVITTVLYSILAAFVAVGMRFETNRRLQSIQSDDIEITSGRPYLLSGKLYVYLLIIVGISALCGFTVSNNAISIIAIIEIGVCYLAALAAAVIDLKTRTIPNYIPLTIIGIRMIIFIYEILYVDSAVSYLVSSLIGCFLCLVVLIIANKIVKSGIGGGDIKLLAAIGFMCGLYVVFSTLFIALICCIVVSIIAIMLKKYTSKDHLPFGPFIYLGFTVMCLLTLY